ncbi:MAG: prolyl oligopeptidase family serine peptidase, partial [Gammaproteobacteria bacterium]|nr:prolyl oligopeptidase family serine peptidase [Gammaproteobacteria bacterium]
DHPTRDPYATVSRDGRLLLLVIQDGFLTNGLYYQRLGTDGPVGPVVRLLDDWDARYDVLGNDGDTLYLLTTRDAPRGRIVAIDLSRPAPADWRTVVPEAGLAIEGAALAGGALLVQYIRDAHAEVARFSRAGEPLGVIGLPGRGTVDSLDGDIDRDEAFFRYTDFTTPRRVYRLDPATGNLEPVGATPAAAAGAGVAGAGGPAFVTEQVFYGSADGTRIPMYIVRRADLDPDRPHPTVLYGYGGFGVSLLPAYSASRIAWVSAGGVYAQANLRGGGEYGEAWHVAGTGRDKQKVFDDFVAGAEWLISSGVTTSGQLAIWGGSNGGLLVGAVLNQRPGLFAAAVPAVGVMDMLRYQTASLNARKWSSDYGLSENPAEFAVLRAYSPYHNIREGQCYPATLVQADANDDRVAPWHSYKYAAALQAAQSRTGSCTNPVLIRIETRSGHGAGASLSKIVAEYADQWAFVASATGLGR